MEYKGIYILGHKKGLIAETLQKDNFFNLTEIRTEISQKVDTLKDYMLIYIYKEKFEECKEEHEDIYAELKKIIVYKLNYHKLESVCDLIKTLWKYRNQGGGLSRNIITQMIECDMLVKNGDKQNISNASYDLSLGDEYYYAGQIKYLSESNPFLAIEPYDYVIASCHEQIMMPRDVSARFDVSVNLFCQGIILSNSTQVDPGFEGKLVCLLFNTSNKTVYLKRREHYTTMEFNKLFEPTTAYHGRYTDDMSIVQYLPPNLMQGALNELKKEIEELKESSSKMQNIYISALAVFVAVLAIMLV